MSSYGIKLNQNYNTAGLCYSLRNHDEHSTVIPMSTSLLTQSIPDFEESTVAFPLTLIFPIVGFASCFSLDITEGAVLFCRRGELQDAWLVTGSMMADCFLSLQEPRTISAAPHNGSEVGWPQGRSWLLCHGEALPSLSTTWAMGSSQRAEVEQQQDAWGARRLPESRSELSVLWLWFNARQ